MRKFIPREGSAEQKAINWSLPEEIGGLIQLRTVFNSRTRSIDVFPVKPLPKTPSIFEFTASSPVFWKSISAFLKLRAVLPARAEYDIDKAAEYRQAFVTLLQTEPLQVNNWFEFIDFLPVSADELYQLYDFSRQKVDDYSAWLFVICWYLAMYQKWMFIFDADEETRDFARQLEARIEALQLRFFKFK